jgi:hypothetical protein
MKRPEEISPNASSGSYLLRQAIDSAMDDLVAIAGHSPNEVLPKEEQVRAAVYHFLRQQNWLVHVEAAYPRSKTECDLRAWDRKDQELWIEVKRAWGIRTSGWVNKPAEQARTWAADAEKLLLAPASATRAFLLVGFFQDEPNPTLCGVTKRIVAFSPGKLVYESPCRPLRWRETGVRVMKAWVWLL